MKSLGTGTMSFDGSISFNPSQRRKLTSAVHQFQAQPKNAARRFLRQACSFLRVADLEIDATASVSTHDTNLSQPNFHHPASDPPPGVAHDPKEQWIALNDHEGSHAPIAPIAIERLSDCGFTVSMNAAMWSGETKTDRLLRRSTSDEWTRNTFKPGKISLKNSKESLDSVLIWSGNFKHGLYGSDLPAVRSSGIVNMSAKVLAELLVDSKRVKEYNKLSLGRTDLQVFQEDMAMDGPFGRSVTKVMRSETRPPMVRRTLVFVSLLHAKELIDGSGYLIVTRAVHHPELSRTSNTIQNEILMGVNLIKKIEGEEENRCLMINVSHIRSSLVPMMVAKRMAVTAATGFINDIRALC